MREISRNDAGAENLEKTNAAINYVIEDCKANHKKAICFITGVPGAGKTLAGLIIANTRHQFEENDHVVFLSGNGPLVQVLQEALARDDAKRNAISKNKAKTKTKAFIQIVHRFRDAAVSSDDPPLEKVAITSPIRAMCDRSSAGRRIMHRTIFETAIDFRGYMPYNEP